MTKIKTKTNKNYFDEAVEDAVKRYILADTSAKKNKIFHTELYDVFVQMIESITRRYRLFIPSERFADSVQDCMTYMLEKIPMFNIDKGFKAYSYLGTISKNYMMNQRKIGQKTRNTVLSYEDVFNNPEKDNRVDEDYEDSTPLLTMIINDVVEKIGQVLEKGSFQKRTLTEEEKIVGKSLINVLTNWEDLFQDVLHDGEIHSKKYDKMTIISEIKDQTNFNSEELRKHLSIFKKIFNKQKQQTLRKYQNI